MNGRRTPIRASFFIDPNVATIETGLASADNPITNLRHASRNILHLRSLSSTSSQVATTPVLTGQIT